MAHDDHHKETLVLVDPRGRKLRRLLLALVMVAAAILLIATEDSAAGWLGLVFFGPCAVVIGVNALLPTRLELDPTGFRFLGMGRQSPVFEWTRSHHFHGWSPALGTTMIAFEYDGDGPRYRGRLARMNRALTSGNVALPSTYGLPAAELVHLLSDWQGRWGGERVSA